MAIDACAAVRDFLTDTTREKLREYKLTEHDIDKVIGFFVHDFTSTQCEIREIDSAQEALLWIAKHAKTIVYDKGKEVQTEVPFGTDYFTSIRALVFNEPYTMFYLDKHGNRLFRTKKRFRLEHFYTRGSIPPRSDERYAIAINNEPSSPAIQCLINEGLLCLQALIAAEKAERQEIVMDIENSKNF